MLDCIKVVTALYDYAPAEDVQSEELTIKEGEVLLLLAPPADDGWAEVACYEKDPAHPSLNAFSDTAPSFPLKGLVPSNYIQDAPSVLTVRVLYDYEARNDEELTIRASETLLDIYKKVDNDWWLAFDGKQAGLVPASYVEPVTENGLGVNDASGVAAPVPNAILEGSGVINDAANQKALLLNALNGFGFAPPKTTKPPAASVSTSDSLTYKDVKFYAVTEYDKKKKKRKGLLGVGDDFGIYFVTEKDQQLIQSWKFAELRRFALKKGKKLVLDFGDDSSDGVREYEGDKGDIAALHSRFELVTTKNKMSSLDVSGEPPKSMMTSPESAAQALSPSYPLTHVPPPESPLAPALPERRPSGSAAAYTAMFDYTANESGELSLRENEPLTLLDASDVDWWLVRNAAGHEGLVPKTYLEVASHDTSPVVEQQAQQISHQPSSTAMESAASQHKEDMRRLEEESEALERERAEIMRQRAQAIASSTRQHQHQSPRHSTVSASPNSGSGPPVFPHRPSMASGAASVTAFAPPPPPPSPPPVIPPIPSREPVGQAAAAPSLPSRPPLQTTQIAASAGAKAPSMAAPERPARNANPVKPSLGTPSVPASRPVPSLSRPPAMPNASNSAPVQPKEMPDPAKMRSWSDKSGTFQIDAQLLGVTDDGKARLFKANGVKIAVALEKLDVRDVEYIKSLPEYSHITLPMSSSTTGLASANESKRAVPARPRPSAETLNMAASAPPASHPSASPASYIYNGFDWRLWLLKAQVSSGDAAVYATKFVHQKMDASFLKDLDRDILRSLEVAEGDILRIKKAVQAQENLEGAKKEQNLSFIQQHVSKAQQMKADEKLAQELQREELKLSSARRESAGKSSAHAVSQPMQPGGATSHVNNPWAGQAPRVLAPPPPIAAVSHTFPGAPAASTLVSNHAMEALELSKKQQREAQRALEEAQRDLRIAQEQSRQAELLREQTKIAQEQQAKAQAALEQAMEQAKKAAQLKADTERALMEARMASVAPPSQPPQPATSSFGQPMPQNIPTNAFDGAGLNFMANAAGTGGGMPPPTLGGANNASMVGTTTPRPLPPPLIPLATSAPQVRPLSQVPMLNGVGGTLPHARPPNYMNQTQSAYQPIPNPAVLPNSDANDKYSIFKQVPSNAPSVFTQPPPPSQQIRPGFMPPNSGYAQPSFSGLYRPPSQQQSSFGAGGPPSNQFLPLEIPTHTLAPRPSYQSGPRPMPPTNLNPSQPTNFGQTSYQPAPGMYPAGPPAPNFLPPSQGTFNFAPPPLQSQTPQPYGPPNTVGMSYGQQQIPLQQQQQQQEQQMGLGSMNMVNPSQLSPQQQQEYFRLQQAARYPQQQPGPGQAGQSFGNYNPGGGNFR